MLLLLNSSGRDWMVQLGVPPTQTLATVRASCFGLCQCSSCNRSDGACRSSPKCGDMRRRRQSAVRLQESWSNRIGEQEVLFAEAQKTTLGFAPGGKLQSTECDLSCSHCCPLGGRAWLHFLPCWTQKVFVFVA